MVTRRRKRSDLSYDWSNVGSREVMQEIEPLRRLSYEGYEIALDAADAYFADPNVPYSGWLHSHIVRHRFGAFLAQQGLQVAALDPDVDFRQLQLANDGLLVYFNGYSLRFMKSARDDVPAAGASFAKRDYWMQSALDLWLPKADGALIPPRPNLLVLWHMSTLRTFTGLSVALTKSAGDFWEPTETYWHVDWPHPVKSLVGDDFARDADDAAEADDLALPLRPIKTTGNEQAG